MKKVILALAIAAFGVSSTFAQTVPAAAAAVKAAPAAAAAAVKAAPAAAAAAAQAPAAAATTEVKKAVKKVKKAHASAGAAAAGAAAAGNGKMTHTCAKGCAVLVDGAGAKCPKCGSELVAVGAKAKAAAGAPAAVKEEAKKM
jgi:hypothetical protein